MHGRQCSYVSVLAVADEREHTHSEPGLATLLLFSPTSAKTNMSRNVPIISAQHALAPVTGAHAYINYIQAIHMYATRNHPMSLGVNQPDR